MVIGGTLRAGTGTPRRQSVCSLRGVCVCVLKLQGSCTGGLCWRDKKGQDIGLFYVVYRPLSTDDTCLFA